jgi:hypothetical protein
MFATGGEEALAHTKCLRKKDGSLRRSTPRLRERERETAKEEPSGSRGCALKAPLGYYSIDLISTAEISVPAPDREDQRQRLALGLLTPLPSYGFRITLQQNGIMYSGMGQAPAHYGQRNLLTGYHE